jgi:hypothetical protein
MYSRLEWISYDWVGDMSKSAKMQEGSKVSAPSGLASFAVSFNMPWRTLIKSIAHFNLAAGTLEEDEFH